MPGQSGISGLGGMVAGDLVNSASNQAQIQGSELAHPKIYIIFEWMGLVKGPVLLFQSFGISMTQGNNNRIVVRTPSEDL